MLAGPAQGWQSQRAQMSIFSMSTYCSLLDVLHSVAANPEFTLCECSPDAITHEVWSPSLKPAVSHADIMFRKIAAVAKEIQ